MYWSRAYILNEPCDPRGRPRTPREALPRRRHERDPRPRCARAQPASRPGEARAGAQARAHQGAAQGRARRPRGRGEERARRAASARARRVRRGRAVLLVPQGGYSAARCACCADGHMQNVGTGRAVDMLAGQFGLATAAGVTHWPVRASMWG
jgi:hypothetical protein